MSMHESFKMCGLLACHGQSWCSMRRAKCIRFILWCVHLWKGRKNCWPPFLLNFKSWLIYCKQKATNFFEMWKPVGFACYLQPSGYFQNSVLSWSKCIENQQNDATRKNLNSLCDVEVILRLPCILSLF